jgi:hypothetical protein
MVHLDHPFVFYTIWAFEKVALNQLKGNHLYMVVCPAQDGKAHQGKPAQMPCLTVEWHASPN